MRDRTHFLSDIARVAGGAVNILGGLRSEIKQEVRARLDDAANRMNLVPREDFEKLESMLTQARLENAKILERLEALEKITLSKKK